jgi:hypothetical protein
MRTVYATALEVRADADISSGLDYVGRWVHEWYRRQRLSVDVLANLTSGDVDAIPAEGHQLAIRHYASEKFPHEKLVDLRWEYPDQYDKSLGWVVRLALLRKANCLLLSLEVAVTGLQLFVAPARIQLGSPRVIRDIARLRTAFINEYSYNLTPEVVGAEDIETLVSELADPARPFPIVLASRRIQDDAPLVDATVLADRLAGLAKVYELADKWAAFRLTEELGKPLSCFAGAVRVYWPRFSDQDDPFAHPLWMPWQFKDTETADRTIGELSRLVFEAAAFRHVEPASITLLRRSAEREAREAQRSDNKKSVDELLDDLVDMEQKLRATEATNAELARDNETLRANAAAVAAHSAWSAPPQSATVAQPEASSEASAPTTVLEAVRFAEAKAKHVQFLPSAHASAADSPYRHPERVQQALTALEEVASIRADSIESGKPAGSLRHLFKQRGFDYADDISRTARGKFGDEYLADYKGRQLDIAPHITIGAKQPDSCLSVHWAWDKEGKQALVAHVGRHKSNTKT